MADKDAHIAVKDLTFTIKRGEVEGPKSADS